MDYTLISRRIAWAILPRVAVAPRWALGRLPDLHRFYLPPDLMFPFVYAIKKRLDRSISDHTFATIIALKAFYITAHAWDNFRNCADSPVFRGFYPPMKPLPVWLISLYMCRLHRAGRLREFYSAFNLDPQHIDWAESVMKNYIFVL